MAPEKKKRKRKVGICVRSWCAMFLEQGCPQTKRQPNLCQSLQPLCSSVHLLFVTSRAQGQHQVLCES